MNGADSLFTAVGPTHVRLRKTMINAFLKDKSPIIESYADLLLTRLCREVDKNPDGKVNLAKYYGYAMLHV